MCAGIFAELHRSRECGVGASKPGGIKFAQVIEQDVCGPTVTDYVVAGYDERVELRLQTEQTHANQRTAG